MLATAAAMRASIQMSLHACPRKSCPRALVTLIALLWKGSRHVAAWDPRLLADLSKTSVRLGRTDP